MILEIIKMQKRTRTNFLIECPTRKMKLLHSEIHGMKLKTFKVDAHNEKENLKGDTT